MEIKNFVPNIKFDIYAIPLLQQYGIKNVKNAKKQ